MKIQTDKAQESQKGTIQRVEQEPSIGGEATIADNRPATTAQRKLRSAMGGAEDNINPIPIQRKIRPESFGKAQEPRSQRNNTGLPDNLKSGIENLSGYGMDDVKVHYNSSKPAQLQAHAYAQGTDIHLAAGQERHLPHEAWHVVQQKQGRVQPTMQFKGKVNINDDIGLEREADVMGAKAQGLTNFRGESSPNENYEEGRMRPTRQLKNKVNRNYNVELGKSFNSSLAVQRVIETPYISKKDDELMVMTVTEVLAYINHQADWRKHLIFRDKQEQIVSVLDFLQNNEGVDGACGDLKIKDLWDNLKEDNKPTLDVEKCNKIKAYTRGVRKESAHCAKQTDVNMALDFGKSILELEKEISQKTLAHIFTDKSFELLNEFDADKSFGDYYKTCKPHLAANNGSEILNYLILKVNEDTDPVKYDTTSLKGWVRNYHRFEKNALDRLQENFENTSKEKPLTFILHSQLDHNGAFFRDKKLTELITNSELYVLMIEGAENLANAKKTIDTLLGTHAKDGLIDQIMIAGHGNARLIQVAGKTDDYKEQKTEGIDLREGTEFLDHVLEKLVRKTGKDKAVVVFNACLTNSNSVDVRKLDLTGTVADQAAKIREYIEKNPSLASYVANWAVTNGIQIKSIGSSASTTSGGDFFDDKNRLTLEDTKDPKFTAPKLEYVKQGIEPTGALRAALETWADAGGSLPALLAMKNRANKGTDPKWSEQLIRSLFARIYDKYKESASGIARLVNIAETLSEFKFESNALYRNLKKFDTISYKRDILDTIGKMSTTDEYKDRDYIPLGLFQLQINHGDEYKNIELLNQLGKFNMRKVKRYPFLEIRELHLSKLIPDSEAIDPSHGQILLALWAWSIGENRGKDFLFKHLHGLAKFPAKDNINDILDGWRSENYILTKLGKIKASGSEEKRANIQVDGKSTNTIHVTPMSCKGRVKESFSLHKIWKEPKEDYYPMNILFNNTEVFIFGKTGDWYAIEYKGKTAFIKQEDVELI